MTANPKFLRTAVLTMLKQAGDYQLPEAALCEQVRLALGRSVTDAQTQQALGWLHDRAFIDFTVDPMSEEKRWKITDSGKAQLN